MARRLQFGTGVLRIEIDDALEQLARRAVENVAPGLLEQIDGALDKIEEDARARWPVRSGTSKEALATHTLIVPGGDRIRGTFSNDVPYSRYIKSAKNGLGGKSAVVELMRKPIREAGKTIARELATRTADEVTGG